MADRSRSADMMTEPSSESRLPRLAPILLAILIAILLAVRPDKLETATTSQLGSTLTAFAFLAYLAWRSHGLIAAGGALAVFWIADPMPVNMERWPQAAILGTLALGVSAASLRIGARFFGWGQLVALAAFASVIGWMGLGVAPADDPVARERGLVLLLGLSAASIPLPLTARGWPWWQRLLGVAILAAPPVVGFALGRTVPGGDWTNLANEWRASVADRAWSSATWCWTNPWVAGPLVAVGLWRTIVRGRRQLRAGEPPIAWLIGLGGLASVATVTTRPGSAESMLLAATGAMLSVFGVADLIRALVERIELKPPPVGVSDVPRVR